MNKENENNKEPLERIKGLARKGHLKFASQEATEHFRPYVQRILLAIVDSEFSSLEYPEEAFVSDASLIGDFFDKLPEQSAEELCIYLKRVLGVPVCIDETLVNVAQKMAVQEKLDERNGYER